MTTDLAYLQAVAASLYPAGWDSTRRDAFVAGVLWQRAQVEHGTGTPAEVDRRRRDAVSEAFPRG